MWLSTSGLLLLFLYINPIVSKEASSDGLIKDAIVSLAHIMRQNSQKLERHETRERQLGEYMKKAIGALSKKVSILDTFKTQFTTIEERISGIEQLISQRDERERIQMQKTANLIQDLEIRLEQRLNEIKSTISEVNECVKSTPPTATTESISMSEIESKLNESEARFLGHFARIEFGLDSMAVSNKDEAVTHNEKLQIVVAEVQNISSRITDIEKSLEKIHETAEKEEKPDEQKLDVGAVIEHQEKALGNITELLKDTANRVHELPTMAEVQALHNETQAALQEAKDALEGIASNRTKGVIDRVDESKEEIKNSIGALRTDLAHNAEHLNEELQNILKGQVIMISTADNVLDTKKRVEYGVYRILSEIGELIKSHGAIIDKTLNDKFDGVSSDIMSNRNISVAELSEKIKDETDKVWRQINIMDVRISESAITLDKLHNQNEVHINDTTSTMDGMKTKVSDITKRVNEVEANLNYLLSRLSLVTQEFDQIKISLGTVLDNIKASFKEVQEKANDLTNSGPYPVPRDHRELEDDSTNTGGNAKPAVLNSVFDLKAN